MVPRAELVPISGPAEFFEGRSADLDAFLYSAELGSAWTLLHPRFAVAIPHPEVVTIPVAYPLSRDQPEMLAYLNSWLDLKRTDGTVQRLYDYWILGRVETQRKPRWSVLRDVLHWKE